MQTLANTCKHLWTLAITFNQLLIIVNTCEHMKTLVNTFKQLQALANPAKHLQILVNTCKHIQTCKCFLIFSCVCKCLQVFASVYKCLWVFASVWNCLQMFLSVCIYRVTHNKVYLLNIPIFQSPNIAQRLFSTRNLCIDITFQTNFV